MNLRDLPHRRAFALAWPATVAHLATPLVGLIDTAVIGHFGQETDLGAVALGSTVLGAAFWLMSFLRTGTTSLVGRAMGAGAVDRAVTHLQRALVVAAVLVLVVGALSPLIVPALMGVLTPFAEVGEPASTYTFIRLASLPAALGMLALNGWFIGNGDTRRPLMTVTVIAALNIGLDVWFVAGLGWGSAGAAAATAIAEWVGLGVAVTLWWRSADAGVRRSILTLRGRGLRSGWTALAAMNRDIMLRTAVLYVVLTFVTAYGGHISTTVLAANAILLQLMYLSSYGQDGYAAAIESMASRELGARDVGGLHRASLAAAIPAFGIGAAFSVAYLLVGEPFVAVLTSLPDVTDAALAVLPIVAIVPIASAGAYLFDGVFLGTGRVTWMLASMTVSAAVFFAVWWLGSGVEGADARNANLWIAFTVFNVVRGLTLGAAYWHLTRRRAWLETAHA